jgi:hypothetical protein
MPQELSYFRLSLLSYLKDSHPNLAADAAFIAAHGDAATEVYSSAVKNGQTHDQAGEPTNEVLYAGLLFSPYRTVVRILRDEFEKEVTPVLAERVAMVLLPKLNELFSKYDLSDTFASEQVFKTL